MKYSEILNGLKKVECLKTKGIDAYNRMLIKQKADVSCLKAHVLDEQLTHRTYFQVSLGQMNTAAEQLAFIEENGALLQDWWHVDQLTQFIKKPIDFDLAYSCAKRYVKSKMPFMRRWGYVMFLTGLQKDKAHTSKILALIKDDDEYYVQMAQAWLIADIAVYNAPAAISFIENAELKYNITGKAIQKICDSYRISKEDKEYLKSLRGRLKGTAAHGA